MADDPVSEWVASCVDDPPLSWRLGSDGIGMLTGAAAVLLVAALVIGWLWFQRKASGNGA